MSSLLRKIAAGSSKVFRRALLKRRKTDGTYEADWLDISKYVLKYGKVGSSIDAEYVGKIAFNAPKLVVSNFDGEFNDETEYSSLWFGYSARQRSIVKIEAGYVHETLSASGAWTVTEFPTNSSLFVGIIGGDILQGESDQITLDLKPLTEVFRQYPASNLTGFSTTGISASQFVQILRDHTDGSGNLIFRPFFGNTTTNFVIVTTTTLYPFLNTATNAELIEKDVWEVIEKLSIAEQYAPFVGGDGKFYFVPKSYNTTTAFNFSGLGYIDGTYGHTIKKIDSYGPRGSKYYSRVQVKFVDANTTSSYVFLESALVATGSNAPWYYGQKTFNLENLWIQSSATAQTIAQTLFNELSAIKNELKITTSFVPHLTILDKVTVDYRSTPALPESLWDAYNWADDSTINPTNVLYWDSSRGNSIILNGEEFDILAQDHDIDNFESSFHLRRQ